MAVAFFAGSVATAQPSPLADPPKGVMPEETWGVAMLDRGTQWRAHEPTRRLMQWAGKAGLFLEFQSAWSELAGSMGLEGEAAFDALLGERALLVLGEPKTEAPPAWGVTTCVTPQNGTTLERGLDAAPRGFDQGRPVMLVERGKFRLSRLDRRDGIKEVDGWTHMLLAPAEVGESAGWIARSIGAAEGIAQLPGEITWYQKTDTKGAYFVASVSREEQGWRAKIRATPGVLGLTEAGCEQLSKEERAPESGLRAGVMLEFSGRVPSQASGFVEPSKELALLLAAAQVGAPSPKWSGERVFVRVERNPANQDPTGFTVLVACEVLDRQAASAWFDGLIAGVLEVAGQIQGSGGQAASDLRRDVKLAGGEPSATRLVVLGGKNQKDRQPERLAGVDQGTLAWTTVGEGAGGWWLMQYTAGPAVREDAERSLRTSAAEISSKRWGNQVVSLRARPAEFWKAAGVAGLGFEEGKFGIAAEVESVEMVVRAGARGLEGDATVMLSQTKPELTPKAK